MTTDSAVLAPFYAGWDVYQQHLVEAVAPLSSEQLALRAAPHLFSVGILAAHIVATRAGWLYYTLEERDERLPALAAWNNPNLPALPSLAELVSGLQTTWEVIQAGLARWTVADMTARFRDIDDNGEERFYTRQWVIWHLIEHDMHHGGELSFTLGMHHVPAIDL